eukprot:6192810-Pleurochrysis_carterae.AAC.7
MQGTLMRACENEHSNYVSMMIQPCTPSRLMLDSAWFFVKTSQSALQPSPPIRMQSACRQHGRRCRPLVSVEHMQRILDAQHRHIRPSAYF